MEKYIYITPRQNAFEPEIDSLEPDLEDMEALGLVEGTTPIESLEDAGEASQGPVSFKDILAAEFKNVNRRYLFPKDLTKRRRLAS
jgi:hypothetical protein